MTRFVEVRHELALPRCEVMLCEAGDADLYVVATPDAAVIFGTVPVLMGYRLTGHNLTLPYRSLQVAVPVSAPLTVSGLDPGRLQPAGPVQVTARTLGQPGAHSGAPVKLELLVRIPVALAVPPTEIQLPATEVARARPAPRPQVTRPAAGRRAPVTATPSPASGPVAAPPAGWRVALEGYADRGVKLPRSFRHLLGAHTK